MKPVTIVGAGFSGLTLAYYLRRRGVPVQIFEIAPGPGGLIATRSEAHGLVETAANALLADKNVEDLFAELQVPFARRLSTRHRRYIFWNKPSRWPLSLWTSLKMVKLKFSGVTPRPFETVAQWAERLVDIDFLRRLLAPALRGVYAGDAARLSANLALGSLFAGSVSHGRLRGSVAPETGMGELIGALEKRLREDGVSISYGREFKLEALPQSPVVLCTSVWAAASIVESVDPHLANRMRECECLPLVTVTAFFSPTGNDLKGFGCLFPEEQNFHALGVLFNNCIFTGRASARSETWIFGGAGQPDAAKLSDEELRCKILSDRARLPGGSGELLSLVVTRWPRALPHYTTDWEKRLQDLTPSPPLYLHGNYLGALGLARILERSKKLAEEIKKEYAG